MIQKNINDKIRNKHKNIILISHGKQYNRKQWTASFATIYTIQDKTLTIEIIKIIHFELLTSPDFYNEMIK